MPTTTQCTILMAALYSLLLSISFFLLFPLLLILRTRRKNEERPRHKFTPSGPPRLPFIGNLHQLDTSCVHRSLWLLSRKYGQLMYLQLGQVPTLVVSSAKMAREVLKTHDLELASRPPFIALQKLSYNGLDVVFAPYGEHWREMRKICILELFNSKRVQSFQSIRKDEVARLITSISRVASSSSSSSSDPVDLSEMLLSLTNDVICRLVFNKKYGDDECERSKFHRLLNEAQDMMGSFLVSDFFPSMGWVDVLMGYRARLERIFQDLDSFYEQVIDEHLDPTRIKPKQDDLADVLLRMQRDQLSAIDLTRDHIKGVFMNILLAGTDTSAVALVWTMAELARNSRVMKKVQDEVRSLIGRKAEEVEEGDLRKLHYLKAVVKETMRLHPPVPLLVRHETAKQSSIDEYEISSKTQIIVNTWAIGRDPESWENPDEFLPERFMDNAIDFKGQHFEFIPFGAGRRGCPGMYLGTVIVELALANLLYFFNWKMPIGMEDINMDETPVGIIVPKKYALQLVATSYYG